MTRVSIRFSLTIFQVSKIMKLLLCIDFLSKIRICRMLIAKKWQCDQQHKECVSARSCVTSALFKFEIFYICLSLVPQLYVISFPVSHHLQFVVCNSKWIRNFFNKIPFSFSATKETKLLAIGLALVFHSNAACPVSRNVGVAKKSHSLDMANLYIYKVPISSILPHLLFCHLKNINHRATAITVIMTMTLTIKNKVKQNRLEQRNTHNTVIVTTVLSIY